MDKLKIGYALTGSFCTFKDSFETARRLVETGHILTPIMSFNAFNISSRFGTAEENRRIIEEICKNGIISDIEAAEPIGPKKMFDVIIVAPCTSNTLAKLALGVNDTPVTMAVKSHLRNGGPVLIAVSTNDALSASAKNIGALENTKNYYFIPYRQDDPKKKPMSMVADFSLTEAALEAAMEHRQLTPVVTAPKAFRG